MPCIGFLYLAVAVCSHLSCMRHACISAIFRCKSCLDLSPTARHTMRKKSKKIGYQNIGAVCKMSTDLFYGISRLDIVEHLGVSYDKAHLITEASTLLQPLGSCES